MVKNDIDAMTLFDHDREPASFHALSREIRQMILLRSFRDAASKDLKLNINVNRINALALCEPMGTIGYAPHIMTWASTLHSTDIVIASDMAYVVNQALGNLEAEYLEIRSIAFTLDCTALRWRRLLHIYPFLEVRWNFQEGAHRQSRRPWSDLNIVNRRAWRAQRWVGIRMIEDAIRM
ncbi:hypothetical protein EG327_007900 [Venturia inaequalis]|uniref:Uncharacterized protein n=2 Tax=Venturia inaequalis TaxID=5025 RepID=A0A8H3Z1Z3_VENIN|nr:hypothetical protein EG327_007900 [Venturia inaequalis]